MTILNREGVNLTKEVPKESWNVCFDLCPQAEGMPKAWVSSDECKNDQWVWKAISW